MTCSDGLIIKFTNFVTIEVYENCITFINTCIRKGQTPAPSTIYYLAVKNKILC